MKKIGLKPLIINSVDNLKRDLLFFDEIWFDPIHFEYTSKLQEIRNRISRVDYDMISHQNADINYLIKKGELKEQRYSKISEAFGKLYNNGKKVNSNFEDLMTNYVDPISKNMDTISELQDFLIKKGNSFSNKKRTALIDEITARYLVDANLKSVITPCILSFIEENNDDFVPITLIQNLKSSFNTQEIRKKEVLKIILHKIPIPSDENSFEKILDFKHNEESKRMLKRLNNWITKISYSKYSEKEIQEELEFLLQEYETRMNLEKLKYEQGFLEIAICNSAELLENLIKLNLSKIVKPIFSAKKIKINKMIAETKAPGKEIAYISKIKHEFKNVT